MAYSSDFRQRVVGACDRGMSPSEVAAALNVAESWVRRLKQWRRERGSIEAKPCGGSKPKLGPSDEAAIHAHFAEYPDTTIAELKTALQTEVSEVTVWRAAKRLGYRFKKSRSVLRSRSDRTSCRSGVNGWNTPTASTRHG